MKKNRRDTDRARGSSCAYKEWGNKKCFGNPIIISDFVSCNVLYDIVKRFSHS